jgi:hypothetical protein
MTAVETPFQAVPEARFTSRFLLTLLIAVALAIGSFVWQGGYGFNIGDEGYLWYGVQRVEAGEVPLLDFVAYDPGRYYWSAAVMGLLHDDRLLALRGAASVFQLPGLFIGLLLLQGKSKPDVTLLALAAITLFTWMFVWYKIYDISASIVLIGVLSLLIQRPSHWRFFFTGIAVGLVAVFGKNHGVYGVAGVLGAALYIACCRRSGKGLIFGLVCCAGGVTVGYLPILIMLVVVPDFAEVFWQSIKIIFDRNATNLPLPVPWPWLVPVGQIPLTTAAGGVLTGVFFIAIIIFCILSVAWIIRQALLKRPIAPQFVAASILAFPYAHYAFSRADLFHLSLGIFPFLIGVFIFLKDLPRRVRWLLAITISSSSLLVTLPQHPGWNCRVIEPCVTMEIGGNTLKVEPLIALFAKMLDGVTAQYAANGENFLVTPLWPGAYAMFKRKSPMREIYALFPRDKEFQQKEIERIKAAKVGFVLVLDIAVDGRDDLRFRNTYPLIDQYVRDNFDAFAVANFPPPTFQFYKPR